MRRLIMAVMAAAFLSAGATGASAAEQKFITIGTGGQTGVYYVVGGSICRLVNKNAAENHLKCTHTTGGSVKNINGLRAGDLDFGVAQSDWQYHAYEGDAPDQFPDGAFKELRAVFSIHPEPFTVVARADSGINTFDDLKGKRVNVGDPGSGQRGTMEVVMKALGWKMSDFKLASELKSSEQSQALCDNKIDAIIFTVGHPNGSIKEATTSCDAKLINVDGPAIQALVNDNPYYSFATIPGGMYDGTPDDVKTFGVRATLVTSTKVDDETVYQVVKAVFDNFDRFKKLHPAFVNLKEQDMIKLGLSAPLDEGAVRYYKEKGWM